MKKNIRFLRRIILAKIILENLILLIAVILLLAPLIMLIPPIKASLFIRVLIISPFLFIGVFLRTKFSFDQTLRKTKPLNILYCLLYFLVFLTTIGYIPKIINIFPEQHVNYGVISIGIIILFNLGGFLIIKIKRNYLKYRNLIEKGKKYDEIEKRLNNLLSD